MDFSRSQAIDVVQDCGYWHVRVNRGEHKMQKYQFVDEQDARRFVWVLNLGRKGARRGA